MRRYPCSRALHRVRRLRGAGRVWAVVVAGLTLIGLVVGVNQRAAETTTEALGGIAGEIVGVKALDAIVTADATADERIDATAGEKRGVATTGGGTDRAHSAVTT